jgi:hypothetical protein
MNPAAYQRFTDIIVRNLEADSRVLGLVAAGSMAQADHMPDEWSDHDFWIVTESGAQEIFRTDYTWLPDAEEIVLTFRETAHGLKIVYRHGHLIEYAVFDPEELRVTKINSFRVLLDREQIAERLAEIRQTTIQMFNDNVRDEFFLFGQFLTNLLVGVGRHARGEHLSGHHFVKLKAVEHLLWLLARHLQPAQPDLLDDIDPFRRVEFAFPEIGDALNQALLCETPQAAQHLLAIAEKALPSFLSNYPQAAVDAVRGAIDRI